MTEKDKNDVVVTIVVVTYNCEKVISENIESCVREEKMQLIVIDNASEDKTPEIVAPLAEKGLLLFIRNKSNKGFTYACNQGIDHAKGKFIFLLNPDATLQQGVIKIMSEFLENNPGAGAVAPSLNFPDGRFQNYTRTFPTIKGLWVESFVPMKYWNSFPSYRKYTCQNVDFSKLVQVEQPAGAALMFRKQWRLDEKYFIYVSDVDLCKNIIKSGYKIYQLPYAKVTHHQSKGGTENTQIRKLLDIDNYFGISYYFKKHRQLFHWISYRVLFFISLLLRYILSLFSGRNEIEIRFFKLKAFFLNQNFKDLYDRN